MASQPTKKVCSPYKKRRLFCFGWENTLAAGFLFGDGAKGVMKNIEKKARYLWIVDTSGAYLPEV